MNYLKNSFTQVPGEIDENLLVSDIAKVFQENWITAYDYRKSQPQVFTGEAIPDDILHGNVYFAKCIYYINDLINALIDGDKSKVSRQTFHELESWNDKGGLCIYLSSLMYCLLLKDSVFPEDELKYIQGYYKFEVSENANPFALMLGKVHINLHAWLVWKNHVIDFSIATEKEFFDFDGPPFTLGKVPTTLKMVGFEETKKTPKKYARQAAKESGMKLEEWIKYHSGQAARNLLQKIKVANESQEE